MTQKILGEHFFDEKKLKTFRSKNFWDENFTIFDRKKFRWKSQWKFKILKFWFFFPKFFRNFEISNFHWLFQRNIFRSKIEKFWSQKIFDQKFSDFFSTKNFSTKKIGSPISIPNDPKIPKITLRTACDNYKNTNNAHEKNPTILFVLFNIRFWRPSGSWTFCTIENMCAL